MQLQITSKPHCVKLTVQSQYVRHWDFLSRSNFGKLKKAKQIKQKKKQQQKYQHLYEA